MEHKGSGVQLNRDILHFELEIRRTVPGIDLWGEYDIQNRCGKILQELSFAEPDAISGDPIPVDPHLEMVVPDDGWESHTDISDAENRLGVPTPERCQLFDL